MDFYLPFTGICAALPGLLLFIVYALFFQHPALIAVLVLIAQYLAFNLFHLDGLMDSADAFLGGADREKRLAILKDSRIGVYGFFAGFAVLGLKAVLLCTLLPAARDFPALVFAYPLWGRFSAALVPCMSPPQNSGGLGALAKDARPARCFAGLIAALFLWAIIAWGLLNLAALANGVLANGALPKRPPFSLSVAGNVPFAAAIITLICLFALCPFAAFCCARPYRKSLGGYTGDALGAAVEIAEVLYLAAVLTAVLWL